MAYNLLLIVAYKQKNVKKLKVFFWKGTKKKIWKFEICNFIELFINNMYEEQIK